MRNGTTGLCRRGLVFAPVLTVLTVLTGLAVAPRAAAQVSITDPATTYTQTFDTLSKSGTSSTVPAGWVFAEADTGANATYRSGTGSDSEGDTYSFGAASASDRAFGALRSGSVNTTLGVSFKNDTGAPIKSITVTYTGEQWRLGATGRADRLDFQWSTDATTLASGAWNDLNTLDFIAPTTLGTVGALDGNATANRTTLSFTVSGLALATGSTFWLRWNDFNATGSDDGLAIDDFSLSVAVIECDEDTDCNDDILCTLDICDAGTCANLTDDDPCDDGLACTLDGCDPGDVAADPATGCVVIPIPSECDDGFACTTDLCDPAHGAAVTGCSNTASDAACDDHASCTTEACDPADPDADPDSGCRVTADDAACDDDASCSLDVCDPGDVDAAAGTGCVILRDDDVCADGAGCTTDTCSPGASGARADGCLSAPNHAMCADPFGCTDDACDPLAPGAEVGTGCAHAPDDLACDDQKACTDDRCDAALGCRHDIDDTNACSDASLCTTGDHCAAGECVGTTVACDDGIACTHDSCVAATGCAHAPDNGLCDDAKACTDDVCVAGSGCTSSNDDTNACSDGDACTTGDHCAAGACATSPLDCDDHDPCTNDSCAGGACGHQNNTASCDDGDAATRDDKCAAGDCAGTPITCPSVGPCQSAAPNGSTCPISNKPSSVTCDDGDAATKDDHCDGAGACDGTPIVCPAPTACEAAVVPNGVGCDTTFKAATATCDDGLATTRDDHCNGAGACAGTTYNCPAPGPCEASSTPNGSGCDVTFKATTASCDDGNAGTSGDHCDGAGGCVGNTIVCAAPTQCQASNVLVGGECVATNKAPSVACDDSSLATKDDHCDGHGACVGAAISCPADGACGAWAPNGTDCTLTPRTGACDDGVATTRNDTCVEGACRGTAYVCAPAQCEASSSANGEDCDVSFKADDEPCDDHDNRTRGDVCDGRGGCAGTRYTCTPGPCQATAVPDGSGCVTTPSLPGSACDDLDPCTVDDGCDGAGACRGEALECAAGEACDVDGACRDTHCVACDDDAACGRGGACLATDDGDRCLHACAADGECAAGQVCRAHGDGSLRCFDADGPCAAPAAGVEEGPVETVEPVEPVESVEPVEVVEPVDEDSADAEIVDATDDIGPDTAEPAAEPPPEIVEPVADAAVDSAEGSDPAVSGGSSGGCAGGGAGALAGLVGVAIAWARRRGQVTG